MGAPWTAFDAPICFWTQKVYPKCSKNDLKGAKVTPKCFKSDPQGRKMHSYRSAKVVQVHQKMSAARYQARRTARSAFNKQLKQRTAYKSHIYKTQNIIQTTQQTTAKQKQNNPDKQTTLSFSIVRFPLYDGTMKHTIRKPV